MSNKQHQHKHYQSLARYYTNIPILQKKCRAVVHLEGDADKIFWKPFFDRFLPEDSFRFLPYSKNENGNDTSGCEQCLKFKPYLNRNFIICIDSDYRYLLGEPDLDADHFVFQTYTYSIENHICHCEGLDDVCKSSCKFDNTIYDFKAFLENYSRIIYNLFIWHIALFRDNPTAFDKDEFCSIINLVAIDRDVQNQSKVLMEELEHKINDKINFLEASFPDFDLNAEKNKYKKLGVTEENVYLYIRGHNLYSLCVSLGKKVCDEILNLEKAKLTDPKHVGKLYNSCEDFNKVIFTNILFGVYPEMQKMEEDLKRYKTN